MKTCIAIIMLIALSTTSVAAPKADAAGEFRGATQYSLLMCKIQTKTALIKAELGEITNAYGPIGECQSKGKTEAKILYKKAYAKVAKNARAATLLKEYYTLWLSAMSGILPNSNERKILYEQRISMLEGRVDEAWSRFEVETGR